MSFPFISNKGRLCVLVGGNSYNINEDHSKYSVLVKAIKEEDEVTFLANCSEEKAIQSYLASSTTLNGKVELVNGQILYNGVPEHNTLTQRILSFQQKGLPFEPMLKFMEKLYQNPSSKAKQETFDFLENKNLPITKDGNFRAYKMVRDDYWSKTAGTLKLIKGRVDAEGYIYNGIGEEIECERNEVDDDRDNECSYGLHVGGFAYSGPGGSFGYGRTIIVEINPADVIAVPKDYNAQKARVCHYVVIEDFKEALSDDLSDESDYGSEDDEWQDNDLSEFDDYSDDEEYEGMDILVSQIRQGDELSLTYTTTIENGTRYVSVESTTDTHVHCVLLPDDPKWQEDDANCRTFVKSKISDVKVLN